MTIHRIINLNYAPKQVLSTILQDKGVYIIAHNIYNKIRAYR